MAAGMNPIDLAGALQQYSAALQSGIGASNQALDAQMAALNTGGDGQRGALLQLAAGFLSPTRTGSFGESLGNAVGNYATADAQARQAQMDRALKLAQIQQARAKLTMEGAGSQFELAQKAYELQRQGQEDDLFSAFQTGGGTLQDAAAQASAGDMLGQRSLAPIMPATGAFDAPMMDAPVTRVNAVPQPLPEPAPAPMFPPRTAAELESADSTLHALRGTGGYGPDGFVDNPVLGAAMGRVLGTPPAPLDLPDQMLDPLTAPPMGPPASFGPSPTIPTSPQPLRRTPEADLPAAGANPAQARTGQTGFAIPGGDEQSLLSPSMALSPQQAGQMRERAARMRGAREPAAPAAQGVDAPLGFPRPSGAAGRDYDMLTRLRGPEGRALYAANRERAAELEEMLSERLKMTPEYVRSQAMAQDVSMSPLGKLYRDYSALAPDDPMREVFFQAMAAEAAGKGMSLVMSPDGTLMFSEGAGAGRIDPAYQSRLAADRAVLTSLGEQAITIARLRPAVARAREAVMRAPEGTAGIVSAFAGNIMPMLGLDVPEGATEAQILQSINTQLAGLYKLPGPVATVEMMLYMQAAPRLGDSRDANIAKIDLFEKLATRANEIITVFRNNMGQPDLYEKLAELDTEIFTPEERAMLESAAGAPSDDDPLGIR